MMTVGEVSALTGVSVRALHHYDRIGLLPPAEVSEAGYRLYDDKSLERLSAILLFRELEFPHLAKGIKLLGVKYLNFTAFDTEKIDEYARQAKASYGQTPEYQEYLQKSAGRTKEEERRLGEALMDLLAAFGGMLEMDPAGEIPQAQVAKVKTFITENMYTCSDGILQDLGRMYAGAGSMRENIDTAGGPGTAEYAHRAIEAWCKGKC